MTHFSHLSAAGKIKWQNQPALFYMYSSAFQPETNILISRWTGDIAKQDILDFLDFLNAHEELPRRLRTLEMMENVNVSFEVEDLMTVAARVKEVLGKYKSVRSAVVSTQPLPVAYGMMYKGMTDSFPNYKVEIFDAVHVAMNWLGR